MTGGGGGPIIIRNLIDNPSTTAAQKEYLRVLLYRMTNDGERASWFDRRAVASIVRRVLKS
jgi:hypothetical protein